jgi:hypothetical protein
MFGICGAASLREVLAWWPSRAPALAARARVASNQAAGYSQLDGCRSASRSKRRLAIASERTHWRNRGL